MNETNETRGLEQVYRLPEVAKALQLSMKTVRKYIANGQLKGSKIGNRWRVSVADLQAFLERQHA